GASKNGGDVPGCAAIKVGGIWAISHQTALSDVFAPFIHHGQPKLGRKVDNRLALAGRREGTNQQQSALDACGNRLAHYSLCRLRPCQIDSAVSSARADPDGSEGPRGVLTLQRCMNWRDDMGRPQGARTPPPGPCLSALRLPGAEVRDLRLRLRSYRTRCSSRPS